METHGFGTWILAETTKDAKVCQSGFAHILLGKEKTQIARKFMETEEENEEHKMRERKKEWWVRGTHRRTETSKMRTRRDTHTCC